ncbi:glycosyltransferase family 32 protein [Ophiostoma piceae UAMH 11346]|uniref:Glycosyltransferase family 32 protein n=1 Tax=Ophiostoma piceae (strain UAMH 11346) TaxID=1262450 RepID=S3CZM0_OPHP1|nr:glycosyltransferase family 32 protein [Ophiostoma piceae UAMH 11346]
MSHPSSRSSSILSSADNEKVAMADSDPPRNGLSGNPSYSEAFSSYIPSNLSIPPWVPEPVRQALQTGQAVLIQATNKAYPHVHHYTALAGSMVPVAVPLRLRKVAMIYAAVIAVVMLFANMTWSSGSSSGVEAKIYNDFPHKIWQIWKVHPLDFEERDHNTAYTWLERNPDYQYEVLTDNNEYSYVQSRFGPDGFNRPDIVDFYRNVRATIVRADLLRYMVMYAEGGVYADIDVEAIKPMSKFVPERYNKRDIDMVIGVEIDEPDWRDHPILGQKSRSFCQWTFISKPQNPVMMDLIENIMVWLRGVADRQKVSISDVVLDFDEIITGTGPSAFTNAIIKHINRSRSGSNLVNWDVFHDLSESKLVGGVLVLTVEAFAAGQGHSDSGNHDARSALVRHHYHASNWPSRHPRYKHPVYGEVERCNWNDDCVNQWDHDVAEFKKLPEKEQRRLIEDHEREEKEKAEAEAEEARRQQQQAEEEEQRRQQEEEEARRREEEARRKEDEEAKKKEENDKKTDNKKTDDKKTEGSNDEKKTENSEGAAQGGK